MNGGEDEVRSFISIDIEDEGILSRVQAVQTSLKQVGADLKIVGGQNVHVTLKFLGNVQSEILTRVGEALDRLRFSPFTLELRGVGAFPSMSRISILWIGIGSGLPEVERIYDHLESEMATLGFRPENRRFNPHITIARVRSGRRREELASLVAKLQDNVFGSFTAESVRLKQSILRPGGPEYRTLYEARAG